MIDRLRRRTPTDRDRESEKICAWLRPHVAAGTVAAFWPLPEEVDLSPLLAELAATGRLVLPRCEGRTLSLRRVPHLDALQAGPMRLREPAADAPVVVPDQLAVVLVPGLAFTPDGYRLGRGQGYYDRLLADLNVGTLTIGVGFADQFVASVPLEAHDVRLGMVVSR